MSRPRLGATRNRILRQGRARQRVLDKMDVRQGRNFSDLTPEEVKARDEAIAREIERHIDAKVIEPPKQKRAKARKKKLPPTLAERWAKIRW